MNKQFGPLKDSILILCILESLLEEYQKRLLREDVDSIVYTALANQIVLTACSYLEEWEHLGKLSSDEDRVLVLRKIANPAIKRINKWSDLKFVRNSVIAHNHRNKKENNSPVITTITRNLNCPNSKYDYRLLIGCIYLSKNALLKVFKEEYNEIVPELKHIGSIDPKDEIKTEKRYRKEFDKVIRDVELQLDDYYNGR